MFRTGLPIHSSEEPKKFTISGAKKRLAEIKGQSAAAEHERKILSAIKKGLQEIKDKLTKRT